MFTVNNKDTQNKTIDLVGTDDITNKKSLKKNLFFHFAITESCVAICLAEDGTRMGGI